MISFENSDNQDIERELKLESFGDELDITIFSEEIGMFYATDDQVFDIAMYLVDYLKAKGYSK